MKITRLFSGTDGESHFEEIDLPLEHAGQIGALSAPFATREILFRETPADYDYSWHTAPCRQFVLMLEGSVEIEVGDGRRTFHTGDILLAEDTTGRGHISRAIDGKPRKSVFVTLA